MMHLLPPVLALTIRTKTGAEFFDRIVKRQEAKSQSKTIWERMQSPYPTFDIDANTEYDFQGKKFFLVDDNSTAGRTFNGLARFIQACGGNVVGYYTATAGQDASEKMTVTDETWNEIEKEGLESVRDFSEQNGVQRDISQVDYPSEKQPRSSIDTDRMEQDRILQEAKEEMDAWVAGFAEYLREHSELLAHLR